jgi:hypothetical protein
LDTFSPEAKLAAFRKGQKQSEETQAKIAASEKTEPPTKKVFIYNGSSHLLSFDLPHFLVSPFNKY